MYETSYVSLDKVLKVLYAFVVFQDSWILNHFKKSTGIYNMPILFEINH